MSGRLAQRESVSFTPRGSGVQIPQRAPGRVVKLVYTLPWGGSGRKVVEVQVLFRPPSSQKMTLEYIFSQKYLFNPLPTAESRLYVPLLILFALCLIGALLIKLPEKLNKKVKNRFFYALLVPGIAGLIYLFARHESLPWLGSRFILALIMATIIIWNLVLIIWSAKYVPSVKKAKVEQEEFDKYLPKKKRK